MRLSDDDFFTSKIFIMTTLTEQNSQKSLHLKNKWSISDLETRTYKTDTSTSWDRGPDQDQLLWDRDRDQKVVSRPRWFRDLITSLENRLKFQQHSALAQHNPQDASSPDARLHHSTKPVASCHIQLQSCWLQNLGNATGVGTSTSSARCW